MLWTEAVIQHHRANIVRFTEGDTQHSDIREGQRKDQGGPPAEGARLAPDQEKGAREGEAGDHRAIAQRVETQEPYETEHPAHGDLGPPHETGRRQHRPTDDDRDQHGYPFLQDGETFAQPPRSPRHAPPQREREDEDSDAGTCRHQCGERRVAQMRAHPQK